MYNNIAGITFLDIVGQRDTETLELIFSDGHSRPIFFSNGIPIGRNTETRAFVSHFFVQLFAGICWSMFHTRSEITG